MESTPDQVVTTAVLVPAVVAMVTMILIEYLAKPGCRSARIALSIATGSGGSCRPRWPPGPITSVRWTPTRPRFASSGTGCSATRSPQPYGPPTSTCRGCQSCPSSPCQAASNPCWTILERPEASLTWAWPNTPNSSRSSSVPPSAPCSTSRGITCRRLTRDSGSFAAAAARWRAGGVLADWLVNNPGAKAAEGQAEPRDPRPEPEGSSGES